MPIMWNSGVDPKLASAAPKCFNSSDVGGDSIPDSTGTSQYDCMRLPITAPSAPHSLKSAGR